MIEKIGFLATTFAPVWGLLLSFLLAWRWRTQRWVILIAAPATTLALCYLFLESLLKLAHPFFIVLFVALGLLLLLYYPLLWLFWLAQQRRARQAL